MKLILLTACLPFCALPLSQAADLFTPPPPKADPYAAYKDYKTSAAFFKATRSGEVPELIKNFRGDYNGLIRLMSDIFQNDHLYPSISPDQAKMQANEGAHLLEVITRYELADEKRKADIEREFAEIRQRNSMMHSVMQVNPKFINALDSFLKDYTRALREHVASKKEREAQQIAAETERQRQADMVTQKAQEERRQAMAIANAKAATSRAEEDAKQQQTMAAANAKVASIKAEEEMRAAAVRGAIAAQEKIREQKLQEVLASPAYKIWQASLQIEEGLRLVEKAKQILAKDDAIQRESGVADLSMRRTAGERIVAGKTLAEQSFATYKKLGGEARKPEDVKAGADPARDYR